MRWTSLTVFIIQCINYSDDEQERDAKARQRAKNRKRIAESTDGPDSQGDSKPVGGAEHAPRTSQPSHRGSQPRQRGPRPRGNQHRLALQTTNNTQPDIQGAQATAVGNK